MLKNRTFLHFETIFMVNFNAIQVAILHCRFWEHNREPYISCKTTFLKSWQLILISNSNSELWTTSPFSIIYNLEQITFYFWFEGYFLVNKKHHSYHIHILNPSIKIFLVGKIKFLPCFTIIQRVNEKINFYQIFSL